MKKRSLLSLLTCSLIGLTGTAKAQDESFKIGLILPMTGPFASTGKQIDAAVRLYMEHAGTTVAGRKIEVVLKDDGGVPDATKRLASELVTSGKVSVLAGFGLTPSAMSAASVATQSQTPAVIMAAATSSVIGASPYMVRTSYTLYQSASTMAQWATKNKISRVVTLVSDYGPGLDAEKIFSERIQASGGKVVETLRVPLRNPDFAPFLQRVRDASPDAVFVFVPSGPGVALMKQFTERGLDKAGIKLIGDGGITDDDQLNDMGDAALGVVTSFHYSAAHDSALNRKFVADFSAANKGLRPNFMAVGGYDGMAAIYAALTKTKGQGKGQALVEAMKGLSFESPRGPISIDAHTRDIVQDIYIRKVERRNGQLYNIEMDKVSAVKDPGK